MENLFNYLCLYFFFYLWLVTTLYDELQEEYETQREKES